MAQKIIAARVLAAFSFAGMRLQPNSVVAMTEKDAKAYADNLDGTPEAISAAFEAGGEQFDLTNPGEEQAAADQPQG